MAYVDLNTIHNPSTGAIAPAAWGDQVRDNLEFLVQVPACSVYNNAAVSIATGVTPIALGCNTEQFDNAAMHSTVTNNSRITIPNSGNYRLSGTLQFATHATGVRALGFKTNGSASYLAQQVLNTGGTFSVIVNGTRTLDLLAGDYVEITGYQNSGGNLNVTVLDFCVEFISR